MLQRLLILLAWGGVLSVSVGLLAACNTTKSSDVASADRAANAAPAGDTVRLAPATAAAVPETTVKVGYMLGREIQYEVPLPKLLQEFISEFGDGTVIDKVMVTPVQDKPTDKPMYYLVGMGQLNGQFRAMALPLKVGNDKSLYLAPSADRHIAQGFNCAFCYFRFTRSRVSGVDCSETSSPSTDRRCSYRIEPRNHLFAKR